LIKNVVEAKVSETKSSQFTLTFEEEGKENVTHTFEALDPQEACTLFFFFCASLVAVGY
jgi:hypothetical protein